ncbi:putative F-box domain-containing protein [Tanacetum coccineum]
MVVFDVVECILLRSAATDLTSWKVVCKSWYSLISSPRFAQAHLNHTCNNNDNELGHVRIAMPSYWKRPNEKRLYESNLWKIVGSSNGLVCISPIQDDYKVVLVITKSDDHAVLVQVLSMKSNTWKLIGLFNYGFINDIPGMLFNGKLHWFVFDYNNEERKTAILSFDLSQEEFKVIPQPNDSIYERHTHRSFPLLGIVDDRLCIFFSKTRSNLPPDIWVMRSYNVEQSWELLPPNDYEMKHEVVHHMKMIEYALPKNKRMSFFCDDNKCSSRAWKDVIAYRFVPSLVYPYAGRPSHAKNNKTGFKACSIKKTRKIEEIYRRQVGDTDNLYFHNHGNREIEEIVTKIEGVTLFAERGRGREE